MEKIRGREEKMKMLHYRLVILIILIMVIFGCGTTKPSRLYLLRATLFSSEQKNFKNDTRSPKTILIGPILIPEYLDRPQMVLPVTRNELEILEHHRWAEPLDENIMQVLAENLEQLLTSNKIFPFNEFTAANFTNQLKVGITRFGIEENKTAVLKGSWALYDRSNNILLQHKFNFDQSISSREYNEIIPVYNKLLAQLSQEISRSISSDSLDVFSP